MYKRTHMSAWLKILTANKFKVLSIGTSNLLYYLQFYTIGFPPLSQSLHNSHCGHFLPAVARARTATAAAAGGGTFELC